MLIASFLRELYHFSSAKTKETSQSLSVQHFVLGVLFSFPVYLWEHLSYQRVIFDSTTLLATAYVGVFALVSYYLWNEAITLTQKNGLIYYLIPFLVEY
jgi:drug/metabolite transporter (DMT)-like permease